MNAQQPLHSYGAKKWPLHVLAFALLLLAQIGLVLVREQPLIMADEAVFLANARYLSGTAPMPTLHGAVFFHFGYSLFLVPAFWLFDSPYTIYTASLVISAFLMSTVYLSLYYVLASLLGISSRLAMVASFLTCLYAPLLLRANFAWGDNAYVPGFMLLIALFGALLRHKSVRFALVFGVLLGFMYTVHTRSLPLIPVAALSLVALGLCRALPWRAVSAALSATALILIGTRLAISDLRTAGGTDSPENPILPIIAHFFSLQGLHDFLLKSNELALYAVQSSFGLLPIGALAICLLLWQRRGMGLTSFARDVPAATLMFFLLAWLSTAVVSAAWNGAFTQDTHFMLGRYVDGISALPIALGLATVLRGQQLRSWRLAMLLTTLLGISTVAASYGLSVFLPVIFAPQSLGIYPYAALFGTTPLALVVASVVAAVGFVCFSLARGRWRFLAVAAIVCLFLLTSAFGYFSAILPLQERVARSSTLASYIRTYLGSPPTIAYDTTYYHPLSYFSYEYLLPHTRFLPFNSAAGELPPAPIVISSRFWNDADTLDARFWQAEPHVPLIGADQALWTLPGPDQSALLPHLDYSNSVLGLLALPAWSIETPAGIAVQPSWGLRQHGLFHPTDYSDTIPPVRFTSLASFHVPTADHPPQALLLNLISTVNQDTPLRVQVNDHTLFANSIPPGNWCHLFPLPSSPNASLTHIQLSLPSADSTQPALMVVRGITLLDHVPEQQHSLTADPLPPSAYRSQLTLLSPPYPQPIVRGTMASLRLTVTNTGDHTWPTPCEIGQTPAAVQLGILWFPSHAANRDFSSHVAEGRTALPYALAPGSSISLTAILAPFTQAGDPLPPGEYEVWIGPVQEGIAWFFQHGDNVLKVPVTVVH